ncbi:hypothetical protein MEBOL_001903 [Melittangium boletus DSM 14713]|uniref:Uncharacterized protein n=1 Tax=Melittangium boletus DSM 14713 TaxID=1294270 RepID=A0A250IBX2_9BACT|nr:hypothetical protein MEBOL_001903 [Melittangium boletus DSM 14713]
MPKSASQEPDPPSGSAKKPAQKGGGLIPDVLRRALGGKARAPSRREESESSRARSVQPEESRHGPGGGAFLDEGEDEALYRSAMRTRLLGEDTEITAFHQARREAQLLGQMENKGEAPTRIVSQLNEQLSGAQGAEFKSLLSRELKPQLDRLAEQVDQATTENRRKIAALIARSAHLAGSESAATFEKLLTATANAEARHLEASAGAGAVVSASEFQTALRSAASQPYRAALIEKARGHIERMAREALQLPSGELHSVLVLLLGAAESLGRMECNAMAKTFLAGALGSGRPDAAGRLVKALGPALRDAPGGGNWVVRLLLNLVERGEQEAALALASTFAQAIRASRERCGPLLRAVQSAADKSELLEKSQKLDEQVGSLAALMPACALLLAARGSVPGGGNGPLVTEALVTVAGLDAVGATDNGQRMLRHTLIREEQGEPSFLGIVPVVSRPLGHPRLLQLLSENGLVVAHYQNGGGLFIQRVARQVFRALSGPVVARSQKGEGEEARRLLNSALCIHAPLYGMDLNGGRLAADIVERLRSNPQPDQAQRVLAELEEVAKKNPSPYRTGYVESLRALVTALAERDPHAAPKSAGLRRRAGAAPKMNAMEAERTHIVEVKKLEAQREAARAAARAPAAKAPGKAPARAPARAAATVPVKAPPKAPTAPPVEQAAPVVPKAPDNGVMSGVAPMNVREAERTHIVQTKNLEAQRAAQREAARAEGRSTSAAPGSTLPSGRARPLRG